MFFRHRMQESKEMAQFFLKGYLKFSTGCVAMGGLIGGGSKLQPAMDNGMPRLVGEGMAEGALMGGLAAATPVVKAGLFAYKHCTNTYKELLDVIPPSYKP